MQPRSHYWDGEKKKRPFLGPVVYRSGVLFVLLNSVSSITIAAALIRLRHLGTHTFAAGTIHPAVENEALFTHAARPFAVYLADALAGSSRGSPEDPVAPAIRKIWSNIWSRVRNPAETLQGDNYTQKNQANIISHDTRNRLKED